MPHDGRDHNHLHHYRDGQIHSLTPAMLLVTVINMVFQACVEVDAAGKRWLTTYDTEGKFDRPPGSAG